MDHFSLFDVFVSLLWFFLFIAWIYLLVGLPAGSITDAEFESKKAKLLA